MYIVFTYLQTKMWIVNNKSILADKDFDISCDISCADNVKIMNPRTCPLAWEGSEAGSQLLQEPSVYTWNISDRSRDLCLYTNSYTAVKLLSRSQCQLIYPLLFPWMGLCLAGGTSSQVGESRWLRVRFVIPCSLAVYPLYWNVESITGIHYLISM